MSKICKNCGNELKDSAKFCGKCGEKAEEAIQEQPILIKSTNSICKNCGNELLNETLFCDKCGTRIEETIKELKCRNCGNDLRENALFCDKCGTPVEEPIKELKCINCGNELREGALFCDKCGTPVEEPIKELKCRNCGNELRDGALFCDKCGKPFSVNTPNTSVRKTSKQANHKKQKNSATKYADSIKEKGKGFVGTIKNYKTLPKQKKRNIIIGFSGIIAVIAIILGICLITGSSGVSDKVVSQAALQVAEQDMGYKLELKSYDVIDSFTAKSKNAMTGATVKAKMYLVIIEAELKDDKGNVVETVKYGVSVVDPKKSGEYISCSPMSHAEECTDMENKDIEEMLRSSTAHLR